MIRKLLATTAIATLVATGAYAQSTPMPAAPVEQAAPQVIHADGHLASDIIGQTVYSSAGDDGENIGSISDIVLSPEGEATAVVIGVGGFLGIGKKDVALEYDLIQWSERDGNRWLVVETTRDALEALPTFDVSAYRPMPADAQVGHTKPATADELNAARSAVTPADGAATDMTAQDGATANPATTTDDTRTAAIDRSAMTEVPATEMRADDLIGTTVYGAGDENVGYLQMPELKIQYCLFPIDSEKPNGIV